MNNPLKLQNVERFSHSRREVGATKEGIMKEAVTKLENLNTIDDLMLVNRGQMNKGDAFNKHIDAMKQHYALCAAEE